MRQEACPTIVICVCRSRSLAPRLCLHRLGLPRSSRLPSRRCCEIARIGEPALSPNGRRSRSRCKLRIWRRTPSREQIYVVPMDGGTPRQLTQDGSQNERPRWSPDSRQIYFISNRGGSQQIWVMDADGSHSAADHAPCDRGRRRDAVRPTARSWCFLSSVYPECGDRRRLQQAQARRRSQSKVKARIYTSLLYPPLEPVGGQAAPALVGRSNVDGTEAEGSDAGLARRASVLAGRSGRLRDLAGFDWSWRSS